jgi:hypothetical protein
MPASVLSLGLTQPARIAAMSPNPIVPADKSTRQPRIWGSLWFTLPGTYGVLGAAYALLPPLPGLAERGERLVLAVRWLLVAFIPYVAVCLTILYERYAEGAHNPLDLGTCVERELTETEVRAEIIDAFQHDMQTTAEYTDDEIAQNITESDLADHFNDGVFEGRNYEITVKNV